MSDELYPYFESELTFIRRLAQEFADAHPQAAARLKLEQTRSVDPHVERLIEAFALLAGRVRKKLDDEFPELTDAVLAAVYPHALAPVPSFATVQFEVQPSHAKPQGVTVPAGSPMHSARVGEQYCRYRTCYPVTVWPVTVAEAVLHPPPFSGLKPPPGTAAALRLRLRATAEPPLSALAFDSLRVHLVGDTAVTGRLYDLLFRHAVEVAFVNPDRPTAVATFPAAEVIKPVGFERDDGLIPYPPNVFPGYRLLTEYFSYPAKFLYADIGRWADVRARLNPAGQVDVVIFLDRADDRLERRVEPGVFRLGCTPLVNLFPVDCEPIHLTHTRTEYKVTPVLGQDLGHEVFQMEAVTALGPRGATREYQPFYQHRHGDPADTTAYWYASRRPAFAADDRGTDLYLHLVDSSFRPSQATDEAVVVRALCTNRDLPTKLPRVADQVKIETGFAGSGLVVRCVRNPTGSLRPASPKGRYWHLISHLNLNHLSLTADGGLDALQGLLRLYDLTDPNADPRAAALARESIEGLVGVSHRRAVAWLGGDEAGGVVRGIELEVVLDEEKYAAASGLLFAAVLERFFALAVSVNSFSRLAVRYRQRDGLYTRWPPRAGDKPLL
jgi:type VI secretion system protein ImpG